MKKKLYAVVLVAAMAISMFGCGKEVTATTDENGNYVVNGSFEELELTNWTLNNVNNVTEELDLYTRETDCYDGVQCLHFYSGSNNVDFTAEQTIQGLEAGTYKLTGWAQGDTAGDENSSIYFYVIVNGETYKAETTLSGYVAWNCGELGGITLTEKSDVIVGVCVKNAKGGWGTIDSISLIKE